MAACLALGAAGLLCFGDEHYDHTAPKSANVLVLLSPSSGLRLAARKLQARAARLSGVADLLCFYACASSTFLSATPVPGRASGLSSGCASCRAWQPPLELMVAFS